MSAQEEHAFPNTGNPTWGMDPCYGMTLRDWFAGQALPQVLAIYCEGNRVGIGAEHIARNVPIHAYRIADAMLTARARLTESQP